MSDNNQQFEMKKYSTFTNIVYVMKKTFNIQPILFPYTIFMTILEVLLSFVSLYLTKITIQTVTEGDSWQTLLGIVLGVSSFFLVVKIFDTILDNYIGWRYNYVSNKLYMGLVNKKLTMNFRLLEHPDTLDIANRAQTAAGSSLQGMLSSAITLIIRLAKILTSAALISLLNPIVAVIFAILIFLHYLLISATKKADKKLTWDVMAPKWRKISYIDNTVSNFAFGKDIRLYGMHDWLADKQREINNEAHGIICESKNRWIRCNSLNQVIQMVQDAALYVWLIYEVVNNGMSVADYTFFVGVAATFSGNMRSLLDSLSDLRVLNMQVNDYRTFMEIEDDKDGGKPLPEGTDYVIRFEDVSFCYPGQEINALEHVNLEITPRQRLAVVGMNGAGKTTLIKLLMRLYTPSSGRITLNGIDIKEFDRRKYFELFAPVFQNIESYAFSMAENVSFENDMTGDKERIADSLKTAGLWDKIQSLPHKLATPMLKIFSEEGVDFSGGEKQKLAIARAIYKNSPVLILDEPTAALDPIAEQNVYQEFDKMAKGKTTIFISHRLASTRFCDKIALFDGGRMLEYGNHDELMKVNGKYAYAFNLQAHYYTQENIQMRRPIADGQ